MVCLNTFYLQINTPEEVFFEGDVSSAVLPARDGEYCILAGHQPLFMSIEVGVLKITVNGKERFAFISEGFAEIKGKKVIVFSQACEWPEDINLERANKAKAHAEERLRHKDSVVEHKYSEISLARAATRIKVRNLYSK